MVEGITDSIVQTTIAEPAQVEAVETPAQDSDLAQRLAILSKKDKAIQQKEQEWKQKLKEIEEKQAKFSQYDELDKLLDENPLEFFKKKGKSFEELQAKMLQSLNDEDIDPIQKQLKDLTQKLASKDQEIAELLEKKLAEKDEEAKKRNIDEQSKHYQAELNKFLEANKEEYELINAMGVNDEVFEVIKSVYLQTSEKGTPKLLTFKEASDLYEKEIAKKIESLKNIKKVKSMFGVELEEDDLLSGLSGIKTLDDSFTQTSSTSPDLKSDEERVRAAAKLFEQQLKGI